MEDFSLLFQSCSYEFVHFEFSVKAEGSLDCQNVYALRLSTYSRHVKKKKIQLSNRAERKRKIPVFVFSCGIKDQGAASAMARQLKTLLSQPPRNGNFCSLASTTVFPSSCLKHKLLDSASSRTVSKGHCSRCGEPGKSVHEFGSLQSLGAHKITTLHGRRKK